MQKNNQTISPPEETKQKEEQEVFLFKKSQTGWLREIQNKNVREINDAINVILKEANIEIADDTKMELIPGFQGMILYKKVGG